MIRFCLIRAFIEGYHSHEWRRGNPIAANRDEIVPLHGKQASRSQDSYEAGVHKPQLYKGGNVPRSDSPLVYEETRLHRRFMPPSTPRRISRVRVEPAVRRTDLVMASIGVSRVERRGAAGVRARGGWRS